MISSFSLNLHPLAWLVKIAAIMEPDDNREDACTLYNLDPTLLSIGTLQIHWYGPICVAGFSAAWYLGRRRALQPGSTWTVSQLNEFLFYSVAAVILGGRLGFVLIHGLRNCRSDWLYPLKIWDGGMSFEGSLWAAVMAYESLALKQLRHIGDVFDFAAPLVGPGIFLGRIGDFMIRQLQASPMSIPREAAGLLQQTTELSEAVVEGIILGGTIWIFSSKPRPRLAPSGLFLAAYGLIHFFIQFLRGRDDNGGPILFGWMTQDQMLSIPVIFVGVAFISNAYRSRTPSGNLKDPIALPR
jgi:phosphatidylglycerol:prolipoprotein diacylglycerol transferase